ncbi:MAG: extracellular solute-binding protein [Verrucomicrobiota bacterium]
MIRNLTVVLLLAVVVALPFVFRQKQSVGDWSGGDPVLEIVSPHNEAIRYEFQEAFSAWHRQKFGRPVKIEWLNIGGTTEISRYLVSEFAASGKTTTRVDLFFGGGEYDHTRLMQQGLSEAPWTELPFDPGYPERLSGETWRATNMFGTALSTFGICYNLDRLRDLGVTAPPTQWADLANPVFFGQIGVADPTKSGSIAKAFEMIIHSEMARTVHAAGITEAQIENYEKTRKWPDTYQAAVEAGWLKGLQLVQLIGANARYFTDSASKVPIDVAAGDAAVGLSIDFYARFQAQVSRDDSGHERMVYITPVGGSSVSADPISLLRGAPNRDVAVRFIEFVLSRQGQQLWNDQPGQPCSTVKKYALRRLPIRRDMYPQACSTDDLMAPTINPYTLAQSFTYRPRWTARHFNVQRDLIRAMCLDSADELRDAWRAIIQNGGPVSQTAAMAELTKLPAGVTWASAVEITKKSDRMTYLREWTESYRGNYRRAREAVR